MEEGLAAGEFRSYGYRWVVLTAFGLILAVQAFLWISFAPIESSVEKVLGVGSGQIRLLSLVGPLIFVFLGSYAGDLADRRGYKFAVGVGVVILTAGGAIRAVIPHLGLSGGVQYWIFLVLQAFIGAGAVFCLANMSKMPIKWFVERQRALATGLATMFFYLGTAIGLPLVTVVASIPEDTKDVAVMSAGMNRVLTVFAIIMGVCAVLFFLLAKEDPPTPSGPMPEEVRLGTWQALRRFMGSPVFRSLCFISFIGYGIYIGLTVTMEKIIGFHGFSASFASYVASGITIGGIVGAAILPGLSEKVGLRRPFLYLAAAATIPLLLVMAFIGNRPLDLASAAVMGFCLLPALPVTFTIVGEMEDIGPRLAGAAVGTLMAVGSIGSILIPILMELLKRGPTDAPDYRFAITLLVVLAAVGILVIALKVKETGPRSRD